MMSVMNFTSELMMTIMLIEKSPIPLPWKRSARCLSSFDGALNEFFSL
jgi:hypothetical protein